jgi:hypothetical protein
MRAGGPAWLRYRLDMAGVVGSNPTRPTEVPHGGKTRRRESIAQSKHEALLIPITEEIGKNSGYKCTAIIWPYCFEGYNNDFA